ncbi:hypothetical protein BDN72DRAFT_780625, partial [Pluteus cervinus]
GLGTATFEESLSAITQLYTVFSRHFPEGQICPWQPPLTSMTNTRGLLLSNRHFTRRTEGAQMQPIPFPIFVDPKGILANFVTPTLIHTEENEVKYFIRVADMARNYQYKPTTPTVFRVGDIVEVQFSLVVYKMRVDQYILKPMLYSIALLDGHFSNVSVVLVKSGCL